jgi:hypothetical protein
MALQPRWLLVSVAIGGLTNALITTDASAHIKWFCLGRGGNIDPVGRLPVGTYAHGCGSTASA